MEYWTRSSAKTRLLRRLFTAIENENVEEVRTLIGQLGGYVNDIRPYDDDSDDSVGNINNYGYGDKTRTPLHEAFLSGNIEILKVFAEAENVDMNVEDEEGFTTVLHLAAKAGNVEALKLLVKAQNIVVDLEDSEGHTALQYALERKNIDEAKILIDAGANVNTKSWNYSKRTAFLLAIEENNVSFAEYLLTRGADINYIDEEYWFRSLLHFAADKCENNSHLDMLKFFLNNGVDVNVQDCRRNTALHVLLEKRTNNKTVKFLIDFKADINLKDSNGEAPLINAIREDNEEAIKLLLDQGCDVKSSGLYGTTLLHCAAREIRSGDFLFDMFEVLLKQGADVNALTQFGHIPLHDLVIGAGAKTVKLFLDYGANVHVKDNHGKTPLFNAVLGGNPEVAKLLIDYGCDVSIVNSQGESALFNAAVSKNEQVVQLLVNLGLDVNIVNSQSETPLFNATKSGIVEVARILVNKGANVNVVNSLGENPLFNAVKSKNFETVQLLLNHGCNVHKVYRNQGWTPLHLAAWENEVPCEILKCLLKNGANLNACDCKKEIPLLTLLDGSSHIKKCSFEKKLGFLLKYSDINLINRRGGHVLGSNMISESAKKIYVEHVAKLKVLNVPLSQSILNIILNHRSYKDYLLRCIQELDAAKNVKLESSWVTFYNLVVDDRKKLKNYAGNADLIKEFEKSDYLNKFPIYGPTMEKNVSKGIKRRELFDQSSIIFSDNLPILNPNHLIIRDIFDYLGTKELSKFCEEN